jgi:rubrerythrin
VDNTDVKFDRTKFDAVWRRVIPEAAENNIGQKPFKQNACSDETCRLRDFMDDEANDARVYCMLASVCAGGTQQILYRITSDEKCHLKKLRAKYFILTGEIYAPPCACPLICSMSDTLRRLYAGEKEGAAAYRAAAETTSDHELADTYLALAEDEARHVKAIGCLIESMF